MNPEVNAGSKNHHGSFGRKLTDLSFVVELLFTAWNMKLGNFDSIAHLVDSTVYVPVSRLSKMASITAHV